MTNTDWMRPLECDNGEYGFDDLMLLDKRDLVELVMRAFHRCEDMDKKIKKYEEILNVTTKIID